MSSISRPSTSQSHYSHRPGTSQSNYRPGSRFSQASTSRLSHRPPSRHAQRLAGDTQTLVTQLTGLTADDDPEDFQDACDSAGRTLETQRYTGLAADIREIDTRLDGLIERADIQGHDALAKAMSETRLRLRRAVGGAQGEDDCLMKNALLPQHIQFLLSVSMPLTNATHEAARSVLHAIHNPPPRPKPLTWADIMGDEAFEGQHWDMISSHSTSSDEPWSDDEETKERSHSILDASETASSSDSPPLSSAEDEGSDVVALQAKESAVLMVERFRGEQYWTDDWRSEVGFNKAFNLGDPSTLGPAIAAAPYAKDPAARLLSGPDDEVYISEVCAVREALLALQGLHSCLFKAADTKMTIEVAPSAPRLAHMSLGAYHSIMACFASISTTLLRLGSFAKKVYLAASVVNTPQMPKQRTLHAFVEGLDHQLSRFTSWCAEKEEMICLAQNGQGSLVVVSLLSLQYDVSTRTAATFDVITRLLDEVSPASSSRTFDWDLTSVKPATLSKALLDGLLSYHNIYLSMGDETTTACLLDMFAHAAAPTWGNIHEWLKSGASLCDTVEGGRRGFHDPAMDDEFFIQQNEEDVSADEFWSEGFAIRLDQSSGQNMVPSFLFGVGRDLLWAGKAIGLLRVLELDSFFYNELGYTWMENWPSRDLIATSDDPNTTIEMLSMNIVADRAGALLKPFCHAAQSRLNQVLVDDCRLWEHLECIEDLFLMGRGDVMTDFCGELFRRIESGEHWSDYHMLNSLLKDAVASSPVHWIDVSLLRLSYRSINSFSVSKTVRGLEGIALAYQMAFPLNYLFTPRAMGEYSSIFVFLLQLRRAKYALENLPPLKGHQAAANISRDELNAFYAVRGKLSWLVSTFTNFIMTYVLHTQVLRLHNGLRDATSLDHMIAIHANHLKVVRTECFMMPEHASICRSILTILDLCVQFRNGLARFAFTRDASTSILDVSRFSILADLAPPGTPSRRQRKRRMRQSQRRYWSNTIGDVTSMSELDRSRSRMVLSDSDSSDEDEGSGSGQTRDWPADDDGRDALLLSPGESFSSRLEEMGAKLDALVRHIQRNVEGLGSTSGSQSTFSVLSFMLEDWDR
ncbi:hypothetical protein FRB93_013444 [Tulasnella sp. JGI-2019a]|nr:hypothetical protein FRB93_013444 [Tulasnella sp. JGI-2019a]